METGYAIGVIVLLAVIIIAKTAVVVPQQSAFVVETLGRYNRTIQAGFHILKPFFDRVAYKHNLKEEAMDIPEQVCITRDNVQVGVDGVLYMQVLDASKASYGITNYRFAIIQLAQTTLRSEIGKIELDRTFEERATINANVVNELDKASAPWGVKVLRYEIKNINPPKDVLSAMEKQMRAEREKRAVVLTSEGERDAKINQAEGEKQRVIKESEANKQQQINEAAGEAAAILAVATATAEGLKQVGEALAGRGGAEAMQLRIAEEYVKQFGTLAHEAVEHARRAGEPFGRRFDDRARDQRRQKPESGVLTWQFATWRAAVCGRRRAVRALPPSPRTHARPLLLHGGNILTGDPAHPRAEAVLDDRRADRLRRGPGDRALARARRRGSHRPRGPYAAARPRGFPRTPRRHRRARARLRPDGRRECRGDEAPARRARRVGRVAMDRRRELDRVEVDTGGLPVAPATSTPSSATARSSSSASTGTP